MWWSSDFLKYLTFTLRYAFDIFTDIQCNLMDIVLSRREPGSTTNPLRRNTKSPWRRGSDQCSKYWKAYLRQGRAKRNIQVYYWNIQSKIPTLIYKSVIHWIQHRSLWIPTFIQNWLKPTICGILLIQNIWGQCPFANTYIFQNV